MFADTQRNKFNARLYFSRVFATLALNRLRLECKRWIRLNNKTRFKENAYAKTELKMYSFALFCSVYWYQSNFEYTKKKVEFAKISTQKSGQQNFKICTWFEYSKISNTYISAPALRNTFQRVGKIFFNTHFNTNLLNTLYLLHTLTFSISLIERQNHSKNSYEKLFPDFRGIYEIIRFLR